MTLSSVNTRNFRAASLALATAAFVAASGVSASAQNGRTANAAVHSREYRAIYRSEPYGRCAPANGGQIMGGFAGADDWLDTVTGNVCHR